MRPGWILTAVVGTVALAAAARAAPPAAYTTENRTITSPEVEARSGPSLNYYATGKLRRGDLVQVITNKKDVPEGWLAIKPPRGAFSWVEDRNVSRQDSHTGVAMASDAPVLAGSTLESRPPSVRSAVLERGALLVILDKPLVASDGTRWLPVEPYPTEVRFIPASAVQAGAAVETVAAKSSARDAGPPEAGPEPAAAGVQVQDPLWRQASQAEAEGKLAEAERLYRDLAERTRDGDLRVLCSNRVYQLQQRQRAAAAGAGTAPPAVNLSNRIVPAPAQSLYGPTPGGNGSAAATGASWSGAGWLCKTACQLNGQPVYALTDYQNHYLHVVPGPGVSLEPYVNRRVNLYGPDTVRTDTPARCVYKTATHVQAVP